MRVSPTLTRSGVAEDGSELAEDPGRRAPDVETVDAVAAVAERPVTDRALDDLDGRVREERRNGWRQDPGDLRRVGVQRRCALRDRDDRVDPEVAVAMGIRK